MVHINIQSINNKIEELEEFINENGQFWDIIALTETWIEQNENLPQIANYNSINSGRLNKRGGGVGVYIKEKQINNFNVINNYTYNNDNLETLTLENNKIVILICYRPPKGKIKDFFNGIEEIIVYSTTSKKNIYIIGDVNINIRKENITVEEYKNLLISYNLENKINEATRITTQTESVIDHAITNEKEIISGIIETNLGDHLPIFIIGKSKCTDYYEQSKETLMYKSRAMKKENIENLKESVNNIDWNFLNNVNDINHKFDTFMEILKENINKNLPYKIRSKNKNKKMKKLWMTTEIKNNIKYKNKLYIKFVKTKRNTDFLDFKKERNKLNNLIYKRKKEYFEEQFKNINTKNVWENVNKLLKNNKNKKKENLDNIIHRDQIVKDKRKICNIFNEYYINLVKDNFILDDINTDISEQLIRQNVSVMDSMYFENTNEDELIILINNLKENKSIGLDGIHPKIIKIIKNDIVKIIEKLINQCIDNGIFPDCLKESKVIPIYKKGSKLNVENYRPVSILNTISKVFERIIVNRITNYFEIKGFYNDGQHGYRNNRSTQTALLSILNKIIENLNDKKLTLTIIMDLSKAFDMVKHPKLLEKLEKYGIRDNILQLIKSYLENRKQLIEIEENRSDVKLIQNGVPQGSILGPILFTIFINDLFMIGKEQKDFEIIGYADDITILITGENELELFEKAQIYLNKITNWFRENKLIINTEKTKYMKFQGRREKTFNNIGDLTISGKKIERVENQKLLGVSINENLKWDEHIKYITKKICRNMGAINKIKGLLTNKVKIQLYYSLIYSHISYCILTYGFTGINNINKLQKLQNRFMKILKRENSESIEDIRKKYEILDINKTVNYNILKIMYERIKLNKHKNIIQLEKKEKIYNTRQNYEYIRKMPRINKMLNSLQYQGIKLWENLCKELKDINSYNLFKKRLKTYLNVCDG